MLSEEQKAHSQSSIAQFLTFCHQRQLPAKAAILSPGDPPDTLFYLIEGAATVLLTDAEGREIILAYLNAGDFIGEMGIFFEQQQNRSVLVRTRAPSQVASITYERLRRLSHKELNQAYPDILYALGTQVSRRLLQTSRKVEDLAFADVAGRVERALRDLCEEPEALTHPDGIQIRITRHELSRIVGCSREKAGQALKKLADEGVIAVSGKTIVVFHSNP
jgi:CRP/FNR family cyclic AMP-dependent transcriptional regulator